MWPGDSGALHSVAQADGRVEYADADRIVVAYDGGLYKEQGGVRAYDLLKYHKSKPEFLLLARKPTCKPGDIVKKGQILRTAQAAFVEGQLAPWQEPGCRFHALVRLQLRKDSILISSERTVRDDTFTSIHIEVNRGCRPRYAL